MDKDLNYYMGLPYKVEINYEPLDGSWIAYCPELGKGTCYAIGETKSEALELLEDEKRDLFELLLSERKEIPEPKIEEELPSGQIPLRIPRTLHKKIKDAALAEGLSTNQYILYILSEQLGERKKEDKIFYFVSKLYEANLSNTLWNRVLCWNDLQKSRPPVKINVEVERENQLSNKTRELSESYLDVFGNILD